MIGTKFSHYRILEELGSGGMGVVYKALDEKLDRLVALKFLPSHMSPSAEEKERFTREAKAASALDHPNICTIYEIGETDDGRQFIAMAYYDGEPLNRIMESGILPVETAFDYARQVASGLSRAHEAGIVHRDIKPGNVIITRRGVAKIVDFGLAKTEGQTVITRQSSTLGTVAYMSPEQTRGDAVDHRTDVWSLGVLLYEMIAGDRPFRGTYDQAIVYSILNEDPAPLHQKRSEITDAQWRLVKKCLEKNPADRYAGAGQFLGDVKASASRPVEEQRIAAPRGLGLYVALGVVGVVLTAALVVLLTPGNESIPTVASTRRVTGFEGFETRPAYSPDQSKIAYVADAAGNYDVWIHELESGTETNLTADHTGFDGAPAWSPDGTEIAFFSDREGGGIFVVPSDGGEPRAVSAGLPTLHMESAIAWSPDGSTLVYSAVISLYTVPAAGGPLELVEIPPDFPLVEIGDVAWSRDGRRVLVVVEAGSGVTTSTILSLKRDGTDAIRLTDSRSHNRNPIENPMGGGLYFISDRDGTPNLWYIGLKESGRPRGDPVRLTVGAEMGAFSVSADGRKVVYAGQNDRSNLWAVPLRPEPATFEQARSLTSENHLIELLDLSPDGQWLLFDSFKGGNSDIWRILSAGGELTRITSDPAHDWAPSWTPEMSHILFHSLRSGNRDIWSLPIDGREAVQVTNDPAHEYTPRMSPDGSKILFGSSKSGAYNAWIMAADGTAPRQVTSLGDRSTFWWYPLWSPTGDMITFAADLSGVFELYTVPSVGGRITKRTEVGWQRAFPFRWSRDGRVIYVCATSVAGSEKMDVWTVSVEDGSARRLTDFGDTRLNLTNADTDGETLYGVFLEHSGDLWEMEIVME